MTALVGLSLGSNRFTGLLIVRAFTVFKLYVILPYLGTIPTGIGSLTALTYFFAGYNHLWGIV